MIENRLSEEYVSLLEGIVDYCVIKWRIEHDDKIRFEERLKFAESTIKLMQKEAEESGYD